MQWSFDHATTESVEWKIWEYISATVFSLEALSHFVYLILKSALLSY